MRLSFTTLILSLLLTSCASKSHIISSELIEVSGIENPIRSTYISINDSGDEPLVYFMKNDGVVFHKMFIAGAKNIDWEDLSFDGDFFIHW
jgi:hypothetical protein